MKKFKVRHKGSVVAEAATLAAAERAAGKHVPQGRVSIASPSGARYRCETNAGKAVCTLIKRRRK